jgi:hypothetical protein
MPDRYYVRTLGYLPADPWIHYVELSDGNIWTIDQRSGRKSNCGPAETFDFSRWRITTGPGIRG